MCESPNKERLLTTAISEGEQLSEKISVSRRWENRHSETTVTSASRLRKMGIARVMYHIVHGFLISTHGQSGGKITINTVVCQRECIGTEGKE